MTIPVWTGGVIAALWFGYLSVLARRWWPAAYLVCIFFAAGSGLLLGLSDKLLANVWWFVFLVYVLGLPIGRLLYDRHIVRRGARENREWVNALIVDLDRGDRADRDGWQN